MPRMFGLVLTANARKALRKLKRRMNERFGDELLKLVLFGSAARGDAGPESDLDVAIVLKAMDPGTRREIFDIVAEIEFEFLVVMSVFALGVEEFERLRSRERRIVLDIEREGVPL